MLALAVTHTAGAAPAQSYGPQDPSCADWLAFIDIHQVTSDAEAENYAAIVKLLGGVGVPHGHGLAAWRAAHLPKVQPDNRLVRRRLCHPGNGDRDSWAALCWADVSPRRSCPFKNSG